MNGLVKLLVRVGIMVGIAKGVEYVATRGIDPATPEGKAAAANGRQNSRRATRLVNMMRRFTRF